MNIYTIFGIIIVIEQSGKTAIIAVPEGFIPRKW
jgi:hypothetical protein